MAHASYLKLWQSYEHTRSVADRNRLVEAYRGLADMLAAKFHATLPAGATLDREDLQSAAAIGLLQAIEKFQRSKGFRFETFAPLRIRGAIIDAIREMDFVPRLERRRAKTDQQVADSIRGILLQTDIAARNRSRSTESDRENEGGISDVADHRTRCACSRLRQHLWLRDRGLTAREKLLLWSLYEEGLTMKQIGRSLALTEARISQIYTGVITRLRKRDGLKSDAPTGRAAGSKKTPLRKPRRVQP